MSMVRDLPPVAGSIIWVKQIDYQLTMYLKRVEDVLGALRYLIVLQSSLHSINILLSVSQEKAGRITSRVKS